jgi:16S rRNA (guanine(966)-N(2))-methyltransferase RsmD
MRREASSRRGGALRIVGGVSRGRRLEARAGSRPTSGRAREALFDILGPWIAGKEVLELFAGSGAVALEALSRGAASACAVDEDGRALDENARKLGLPLEVRAESVERAIPRLRLEHRTFDLVFADPPYGSGAAARLGDCAVLLRPGGRLVVQADSREKPESPGGLRPTRIARYGRNVFHFFEAG